MDAGQLKIQLSARVEDVCKFLLPEGNRSGAEWCVGSVNGEKGQSLKVHLAGEKAGVWSDFAESKSGDLLDLYRAVKGVSLPDAISWAKSYLGVIEPEFDRTIPPKQYKKPIVKDVRAPQNGALDYLTKVRGLTPETIKAYQMGEQDVRTFHLPGDKTHKCAAVVFPFKTSANGDLKFVKYLGVERPDGNRLINAEAGCEPILFGWQSLKDSPRSIVLAEGELNAASWHQYGFPSLAVPLGAGNGNKNAWIASEWNRLEQFETIYLSFDQDKPGRDSITDLVERLGRHRCRVVPPMPDGLKDINDCLVASIPKPQIQALLDSAKTCDPKELRSAVEFTEDVIEQFYPPEGTHLGVAMPFGGYADKFAFRLGELTIATGTRGHGKTQALNWIHVIAMEQGERVCIASFEMPAKVLLRRMVRQITTLRLPSTEYIRRAMRWFADKLWIYDHVGTADRKRILEVFEYAYRRYGVRYFVVDSLMKCRIGGDDYNGQDAFLDDLDSFCQRLGVHVTLVAHARKDKDESQIAGNNDVKGSGGITDKAWNVISIWRNKAKEIAVQKMVQMQPLDRDDQKASEGPDCIWYVDKQREGDGWIGKIELGFDPDSQQFVTADNPVRVIVPFEQLVRQDSDDDYQPVEF